MNLQKGLFSLFFLFLFSFSYGQFGVGAGIVVASHSGFNAEDNAERVNGGLYLEGMYRLNEDLAFGANAMYFYPSTTTSTISVNGGPETKFDVTTNNYQANLDLQYSVIKNEYNRGYVLLGPSYGNTSSDGISTSFIGGHVGFGVEMPNHINYDLRFQYRAWEEGVELSKYQVLLKVGYLFSFDGGDEEEEAIMEDQY